MRRAGAGEGARVPPSFEEGDACPPNWRAVLEGDRGVKKGYCRSPLSRDCGRAESHHPPTPSSGRRGARRRKFFYGTLGDADLHLSEGEIKRGCD